MLALKEYFEIKVKNSCDTRFEVACKDKVCKFIMHATKLPNRDYWQVRTFHKYTRVLLMILKEIPSNVKQIVILPSPWRGQVGKPNRKKIPLIGEGNRRRRCSQSKSYSHNRQNYPMPFVVPSTNSAPSLSRPETPHRARDNRHEASTDILHPECLSKPHKA
ncbi:Uncharacterized protein TCM_036210 [Theobroma cacao]|uniref:Uncharacterized protein n=1 Tax=Theobroma cacao TaxID=3641 RepID=A0A061FRA5_THECC|nr:Uncharacterized protein TCM_036210 [Theobroma cacao]